MKLDPILATDHYKVHHKFQYHPLTEMIYSNFTPRSRYHAPAGINKVVNFGLQGFIKSFLMESFQDFFNTPMAEVITKYSRLTGVNTSHITALHDLGYLPIEIKALPEGELVPMKVPMFTIKNTKPEFFWLVNYLETVISNAIWKPTTVASIAFEYRKILDLYADVTGAPKDFIYWQGHDFSMRGMSGVHDAQSSGAGHLLSFTGTDTIPAIDYLENYYRGLETFVGASVPASEHSTASANILFHESKGLDKAEAERAFFKWYITELYPSGIASYVSDTYDFFRVIDEIAPSLKQEIESRKPDQFGNAKVVFRPDSGDPLKIVCGYKIADFNDPEIDAYSQSELHEEGYEVFKTQEGKYLLVEFNKEYGYCAESWVVGHTVIREISKAEAEGAIRTLDRHFGSTLTDKGYKVLNPRVGVIYGDSITLNLAKDILDTLEQLGYASSNIVFGIGSFTYQYLTRDTFGFAMKATYTVVDGKGIELYKDPATDSGTKKSAKGLLRVEKEKGTYVLYDQQTPEQEQQGELKTVFKDGKLIVDQALAEIRQRVENNLKG